MITVNSQLKGRLCERDRYFGKSNRKIDAPDLDLFLKKRGLDMISESEKKDFLMQEDTFKNSSKEVYETLFEPLIRKFNKQE